MLGHLCGRDRSGELANIYGVDSSPVNGIADTIGLAVVTSGLEGVIADVSVIAISMERVRVNLTLRRLFRLPSVAVLGVPSVLSSSAARNRL